MSRFFVSAFVFLNLILAPVAEASEIRVYAAASLTDALNQVTSTYQSTHANIHIRSVYSGSATLAKQIERGAPADIFISADQDWMNYLQTRGFIYANASKNLLANDLVIIAPRAAQVAVTFTKDFNIANAWQGKLCTGETNSVPVGKYAKEALIYYDWWAALEARIVGAEDVRIALTFVERGECSLGIVYATDAQLSHKVKVVARFPAASHQPIIYPAALLNLANVESRQFWEFLQTDAAQNIFAHYGFHKAE